MPRTKEKQLTAAQLNDFRIASNRVSVESIRYAADICGYSPLTTDTITALESSIETGSANFRVLLQRATKSTFANEPLLGAILCALRWASSENKGGFRVGNIVDAIRAAKLKKRLPHSDVETYKKLEDIHSQYLGPYYQKLKTDEENTKENTNE
jgi:hypothetical protein